MVQGFEQCGKIDYYDTFALLVKWVTIQTSATLIIHEDYGRFSIWISKQHF